MTTTPVELSALARELLLHLYEQQRIYRLGSWDFSGTLWSKAAYLLARDHAALRPSPAHGRHNMTRGFEQRILRLRSRLLTVGLLQWRSIRPPEAPARFTQGYKRHRARERDLFLTDEGLGRVEALLRELGRMSEPEPVACEDLVAPDGPVAGGVGGCDD